jgi:hypothetical protein
MLWREAEKPRSRRSIVNSAIVVGVLCVVVLGAVLVSGHLNPRDPADFLREGEVLVPVLLDGADHVRVLEFSLEYDTDVVTAVSVIQGDVGRLAVMQYDIDRSGTLQVLVRDVTGVSGTGSVVIVRFRTNQVVPEPASLRFTSLDAIDTRTMLDMPVQGEDGWIDTATLEIQSPVIRFP